MALSNDTELSFGRYLQSCRKMKNLSLEDIANDLKIGTGVLKAIENEDLSRMPENVFAKGFLKGYARIVSADEGRVIHDYLQRRQQLLRSIQSDHNLIRENDSFWRRLLFSIAVLVLVIGLTIFVLSRPEEQQVPKENTARTAAPALKPPVDSTVSSDKAGTLSPETVPETIRLSVVAVEDTWLKIIIDNDKTREYTLRPGDRLEFEASHRYNLLIGNAAGVKLFSNGVPIDVPGEKGKVVNIEIP